MASKQWSGFSAGTSPADISCVLTYDDVTFQLLGAVYWNQTGFPGAAVVIDPSSVTHTFTLASGSGSASSPITSSLTGLNLTMQHQQVTTKLGVQTVVTPPAGWQLYFQWPS